MEKVVAYLMLPALVTYFASMRRYHRTATVSAAVLTTGTVFLFGADLASHKYALVAFDLLVMVLFALMFVSQSREVIASRRAALRERKRREATLDLNPYDPQSYRDYREGHK